MRRTALALAALAALAAPVTPAAAQDGWPGNYPEGPIWIGKTLYWAEMYDNRVMAWSGGAPQAVFRRAGCGPTAIAPYRETDLIVLCHIEGALAHLDKDGNLIGMIRTGTSGAELRNPNDASADGQGGVWFTDPGRFAKSAPAEGAVYYLAPDGTVTLHVTGLHYGNGVYVDRDGQRLLVSEHLARRVLAYPLTSEGLGAAEVLIDLATLPLGAPRYREAGPDGLEIAPDGTLWIADYGVGRILGWQDGRGLVAALGVAPQFVTNIAFGPDGLAAMTGARDNRNAPFPGGIWVFEAQRLIEAAAAGAPDGAD